MTSTSDVRHVDHGHQEFIRRAATPMTEIFSTVDVDFYSGEGGGGGGGGGGDVFGHEKGWFESVVRGGGGGESGGWRFIVIRSRLKKDRRGSLFYIVRN
jgi:hypothetical protein